MEKWLTPGVRAVVAALLLAVATVLAPVTVRGLCGPVLIADAPPVAAVVPGAVVVRP